MRHQNVEGELLIAVGRGDAEAFSTLYDRAAPKLYAVAREILGSGTEADEALQESFAKIWRHADQWPGVDGTALPWLLAIARHTAIDARRSASRRTRAMARAASGGAIPRSLGHRPEATPEETAGLTSERMQLIACLGELPNERAEVIRKAYFSGESYAEIAEETGRPEGTLKSWVHRSLTSLRQCLEGRGVEGAS